MVYTWKPEVLSWQDYFPFGMVMPGRILVGNYRFGYNTQESLDEVKGVNNHYSAYYWESDPRLGRRWNIDPVIHPWESSYGVNHNNPLNFIDPDGDAPLTAVLAAIATNVGKAVSYAAKSVVFGIKSGLYKLGFKDVFAYGRTKSVASPIYEKVPKWTDQFNLSAAKKMGTYQIEGSVELGSPWGTGMINNGRINLPLDMQRNDWEKIKVNVQKQNPLDRVTVNGQKPVRDRKSGYLTDEFILTPDNTSLVIDAREYMSKLDKLTNTHFNDPEKYGMQEGSFNPPTEYVIKVTASIHSKVMVVKVPRKWWGGLNWDAMQVIKEGSDPKLRNKTKNLRDEYFLADPDNKINDEFKSNCRGFAYFVLVFDEDGKVYRIPLN